MEIVEAFGSLKAFHFEHNVEGVGQCAFLEVPPIFISFLIDQILLNHKKITFFL